MAATSRNAPLQLHDTSKTISWPSSAAVSQVIQKPVVAPSGAGNMRAPAPPPPALPAAKATPAPRIGFTPNMLQSVRGNLKRAQPRSRQQSEEPAQPPRQRQASPPPPPSIISHRQARSRGQSAEPQEAQPLRNLLKNPIKPPANRPPGSPAITPASCGCKKLDFASEKALSGILMHMTSVLTVISNQNAKLDKQSERLARMEELQQKQSQHMQQVLNSHNKQESDIANLQNILTSNAEKSSTFQKDLKSQLEQIGIDIVIIKSSDSSRRHSYSPVSAPGNEDMLKLIDEKLQSLLAKASSSPTASPQQSISCGSSARYDADFANVISKVDHLTELHANLSKLPENVYTQIKTATAPLQPLLATCTTAMEASHKQQEAHFAYFSKQADTKSAVDQLQKKIQDLYQAEKAAAEARHSEAVSAAEKKHQELIAALRTCTASIASATMEAAAHNQHLSAASLKQSAPLPSNITADNVPGAPDALVRQPNANPQPLPASRPSQHPDTGTASQPTDTAKSASQARDRKIASSTNAPLRRQKTSLANMANELVDTGTHYSEGDQPVEASAIESARPMQEKQEGPPQGVSQSSLGRRISLFGNSSQISFSAGPCDTSVPVPTSVAPVLTKLGDTSFAFRTQGLLSKIAAQSQTALEGSDASAMAVNSQNFACLQDSQSMPTRKEPSLTISHPNITKLSSSSESSSNSSTDSSSSSSGRSKAKPVVKEVKMTYAKKASLKRKILQSEDDPESQDAEPARKEPENLAPNFSTANFRKSTWVKMPGLEEAASFVSLRKQQRGEGARPDPDRVAHSSDTDYSDPVNLKAPSIRGTRRSTSPLTSLDSEGGSSRPESRNQDSPSKPSSSPELLEPPSKVKAAPVRTSARTRRGVSGSPPPPARRAAPRKSLKNGSPDSSTSADDLNDLDYGAGGGTKGKGRAAAQPVKKKRKTGR